MSWKVSVLYWSIGPVSLHVWAHALDPNGRRIWDLGVGARTVRVWPWRFDPDEQFLNRRQR